MRTTTPTPPPTPATAAPSSTSSRAPSRATLRRRIRQGAWALAGYLVLVLFLSGLGLSPDPVLIGLALLALGSLALVVGNQVLDEGVVWPQVVVPTTGLGRGSDHRTASLSRRLATAHDATEGSRSQLAADLHERLVTAVADRTLRVLGRDPRVDAQARSTLPDELSRLLSEPPSRGLLDLAHLSTLLDRIERLP